MLPLPDGIRARRLPLVTAANVAVWLLYELPHPDASMTHASFYPCSVTGSCHAPGPRVVSWFTAMCLHASWSHLLGNVEDAFGCLRYLGRYVVGGFVAPAAVFGSSLVVYRGVPRALTV